MNVTRQKLFSWWKRIRYIQHKERLPLPPDRELPWNNTPIIFTHLGISPLLCKDETLKLEWTGRRSPFACILWAKWTGCLIRCFTSVGFHSLLDSQAQELILPFLRKQENLRTGPALIMVKAAYILSFSVHFHMKRSQYHPRARKLNFSLIDDSGWKWHSKAHPPGPYLTDLPENPVWFYYGVFRICPR